MTGRRVLLLLLIAAAVTSGAGLAGASGSVPGWQVLTKRNFSSQIRLHPEILLIVTVPWCGESRSLMKEVARHVADKKNELGHLRLMVVFRNSEKMLADVLGAAEGITLFHYHHSVQYKYQGRLRAQNILSSVHYVFPLRIEEVPLKPLRTKEDLERFFRSTDKAVLLLEFCGWSARLLHANKNETRYMLPLGEDFSEKDGIFGDNQTREVDGTLRNDKKDHKVMDNEELTCGVENGFAASSWLRGFTWANESNSQVFESRNTDTKMSCTPEEFQRFESFFLKLTTLAREFLLPPERQRFGLISERSLLPFLGVDKAETWLLMLQFSGCSNCSFILQEGDDLRTVLQMQHPLVMELDANGQNLEPVFPAKRPSIVLFIDRSSESSEVRGKSKSSLETLRRFAESNQRWDMLIQEVDPSAVSLARAFSGKWRKSILGPSSYLTSKGSPTHKIVKTKDNMAIMIINEGESTSLDNLASDSQGNPVYDLLAHLLHQKNTVLKNKETKISVLAKEVGFQLLSNDFEVEVIDTLPSLKKNDQSNDTINSTGVSPGNQNSKNLEETNKFNTNKSNLLDAISVIAADEGNQHAVVDMENDLEQNREANFYTQTNTKKFDATSSQEVKNEISIVKSTETNEDDGTVNKKVSVSSGSLAENSFVQESPIVEEYVENDCVDLSCFSLKSTSSMEARQNLMHDSSRAAIVRDNAITVKKSVRIIDEPQIQRQSFLGSFFFSDGGYQLLEDMTAGSKIPSLVIIDPVSQKHYVFSEDTEISYSSLVNFVDRFLRGNLTPYQRSDLSIESTRETPRPPFVNLDFHEADSIPRITAKAFCELAIGFKHCEVRNEASPSSIQDFGVAWNMDVLVLFSTPWCGFCQRMELIVREVYCAFRGYTTMLQSESKSRNSIHTKDKVDEPIRNELPSIFLMDCTLNDCSLVLEPMGKKEIYPTLLLFPAKGKDAISYKGDISVVNIIEFLVSHGNNSHYLSRQKGFLWTHELKGGKSSDVFHEASLLSVQEQSFYAEDRYSEILLKTPIRKDEYNPIGAHESDNFHDEGQYVVKGSILAATDMLRNVNPFSNSTIVIVAADQNQGFLGLILNKRISWDVLRETEHLKQAPLFFGGPVMDQALPLVSLARNATEVTEGYAEVIAGVYFGSPVATSLVLKEIKLGSRTASDYWFFLGYSSWGWNQLFEELAQGVWHLTSSPIGHIDWPDN